MNVIFAEDGRKYFPVTNSRELVTAVVAAHFPGDKFSVDDINPAVNYDDKRITFSLALNGVLFRGAVLPAICQPDANTVHAGHRLIIETY